MLPRDERLSSAQFAQVWEAGRVVRTALITVRVLFREDEAPARAAFVVPRKSGKATQRNKLRRRVRECYRLGEARLKLRGRSMIFLLNAARADAGAEEWTSAFDELARRIARLPNENRRSEQKSDRSGNAERGNAERGNAERGNAERGNAERGNAERNSENEA